MSSDQKRHAHNGEHNGDQYVSKCDCDHCSERFGIWCKEKKKEGKVVCEVRCKTICHYECISKQTEYREWGWEREFKHREQKIKPVPPPEDCKDCHKNADGENRSVSTKKFQTLDEAIASPDGHDVYTDEEYIKKCDCDDCGERHKIWCKRHHSEEKISCRKTCKSIRYYHCKQKVETVKQYGWTRKFSKDWRAHEPSPLPKECKDCKPDGNKHDGH